MKLKFFEVTAKCGHVGAGRYYAGKFYVRAENKREAGVKVRLMPRVKHDKKHAIISVDEIGYDEYMAGVAAYRAHPYFRCRSAFEQGQCYMAMAGDIHYENWRISGMLNRQLKWVIRKRSERKYREDFLLRMWRKSEKYKHNYIIERMAA